MKKNSNDEVQFLKNLQNFDEYETYMKIFANSYSCHWSEQDVSIAKDDTDHDMNMLKKAYNERNILLLQTVKFGVLDIKIPEKVGGHITKTPEFYAWYHWMEKKYPVNIFEFYEQFKQYQQEKEEGIKGTQSGINGNWRYSLFKDLNKKAFKNEDAAWKLTQKINERDPIESMRAETVILMMEHKIQELEKEQDKQDTTDQITDYFAIQSDYEHIDTLARQSTANLSV
ncbi:MAG TPA: hypothetical protein DCP90_04990 [Clostridiales bacterium]|nr:MAG: hypothetical protein A2Y22_06275 [Clostridiales bacterium GWD2_32_59]HAN09954.1 hypothetical protein [Clostridiales bacterium]